MTSGKSGIISPPAFSFPGIVGLVRSGIAGFFSFEMVFVLFLFAGVVKENPRLSWLTLDLTGLSLFMSMVTGLAVLHRRGWKIQRRLAGLLVVSTLFFLWALCSVIWTESWGYGGKKAVQLLVMGFWGFVGAAVVVADDDSRFKRFCFAVSVLAFWMVAELTNLLVTGDILQEWDFANNYLGFGRLIGISVIVCVGILLWGRIGPRAATVIAATLVFLVSVLMISGGRGPFLAVLATMIVPLVRDVRRDRLKFAVNFKLFLFAVLLLAVLAGFVMIGNQYFGFTTIDRIWVLLEEGGGNSAGERVWYFERAVELWRQNILFGHGIGNFGFLLGWGDVRAYPHNIVLEILVELGLVGLGLFVLMFAASLRNISLPRIRSDALGTVALMFLVSATLNSLVSGDLLDNRVLFAFLGLCSGRFLRTDPHQTGTDPGR